MGRQSFATPWTKDQSHQRPQFEPHHSRDVLEFYYSAKVLPPKTMALWIWGSHGQVHELLGGLHLGSTPGDPLGASVEKLSHCLMFAFPSVCPWDDNTVSMDCCLKYFT